MNRQELESTFDQMAAGYDQQWARLAAFPEGLHLLVDAAFSRLPDDARLLCVGAGTGAEIHHFAQRFPGWRFVAVEPSAGMVEAARKPAAQHGYLDRCTFHTGYLESLPEGPPFDVATSFLVSQFLLDPEERTAFFRAIAERLKPGGLLASSDLALDPDAPGHADLLEVWMRTLAGAELAPERQQQMRAAYARDVAIRPPREVAALIASAGFEPPVQLYQAGLIHAWYSQRRAA